MITIDLATCFAESMLEKAKFHCRSFGSEWDVAKETSGSIVCTKNSVEWYYHCLSCDFWRLIVFKSGSDEYGTGSQSTHTGSYYGGHSPCTTGDNLPLCGNWKGILESYLRLSYHR